MLKVLTIFGTRPEAIKLAPVISELKIAFDMHVCVTGQHKDMLNQVMQVFDIVPDHDLDIMSDNQKLGETNARILVKLDRVLARVKPDIVLVQGDTTTAFAASLASFYQGIPVGHIEAGLRTHDLSSPFPEELNRQLVSRIAELHFAPTVGARDNLLKEGISPDTIHVTGNTVIDAFGIAVKKAQAVDFSEELYRIVPFLKSPEEKRQKIILVTGHRRENFGVTFESICQAIRTIAVENHTLAVIYPVHLNPNVQEPVKRILGNVENIFLPPPLDYLSFVKLLDLANLVLTDSGGIQEEAPSLGKPVLVMRKNTERPEGVEAGTARVVGVTKAEIIVAVNQLLNDQKIYDSMACAQNPYGDGFASRRIREILEKVLGK